MIILIRLQIHPKEVFFFCCNFKIYKQTWLHNFLFLYRVQRKYSQREQHLIQQENKLSLSKKRIFVRKINIYKKNGRNYDITYMTNKW